jgi:hypothetical protein
MVLPLMVMILRVALDRRELAGLVILGEDMERPGNASQAKHPLDETRHREAKDLTVTASWFRIAVVWNDRDDRRLSGTGYREVLDHRWT